VLEPPDPIYVQAVMASAFMAPFMAFMASLGVFQKGKETSQI